ncbi:MAG: hypothetical protein NXI31_04745 [bacterium]|nr:hypothetical protein [bacterium]
MRIAHLLLVPALLTATTTLAAQEFSKAQRAELRQIIREEIRAALQSPHSGSQQAAPKKTKQKKGMTALRLPTAVIETCPALQGQKAITVETKPQIVHFSDGKKGSFAWSTVAPEVEVHEVRIDGNGKARVVERKATKTRKAKTTRRAKTTDGGMFVFDGDSDSIAIRIDGDAMTKLQTIKPAELHELLKQAHGHHGSQKKSHGNSQKGKAKNVRTIIRHGDGDDVEVIELHGDALHVLEGNKLKARLHDKELDLKKLELDLAKLEKKLAKVIEIECEECEAECEEECEEEECCEECESEECCEAGKKAENVEIEIEITTEPRQHRRTEIKKIKNARKLMR